MLNSKKKSRPKFFDARRRRTDTHNWRSLDEKGNMCVYDFRGERIILPSESTEIKGAREREKDAEVVIEVFMHASDYLSYRFLYIISLAWPVTFSHMVFIKN